MTLRIVTKIVNLTTMVNYQRLKNWFPDVWTTKADDR